VEDIAKVIEDRRFRGESMVTVGQLEENILDTICHQFQRAALSEFIAIENSVRPFMERKIQNADKIDRGKIIGSASGSHLFLNSEGGIEKCTFMEVRLISKLHFDNETGTVFVGTFYIDSDTLVVGERVDMLLGCILERNYFSIRNELLKKKRKETLTALCAKRSLEPIVKKDAGIAPGSFDIFHSFFRQKSNKRAV
jgi:hypothetical protein